MKQKLKIAVIGCGTAGLAVSAFLAKDEHDIQLFERFDEPKPLGAGLLLQPTGLACLAALGLDEKAIHYGAEINNLYGRSDNGRVVFDISYRNLRPHYFGLGIHRGTLFSILYEEVQRLNIPIQTGCEIKDTKLENNQRILIDTHNQEHGPFDLVIDASGMRSPLRKEGLVRWRNKIALA